jgi:hypothetical protein
MRREHYVFVVETIVIELLDCMNLWDELRMQLVPPLPNPGAQLTPDANSFSSQGNGTFDRESWR